MNVLFIIISCGGVFLLAYFTYGKFLSKKVFQLDDKKTTPAVENNDGMDYVPAKKGFLLGQHLSAIAAVLSRASGISEPRREFISSGVLR